MYIDEATGLVNRKVVLMQKYPDSDTQVTTVKMPKSLHKDLRVIAAEFDTTIQQLIVDAMTSWVDGRIEARLKVRDERAVA